MRKFSSLAEGADHLTKIWFVGKPTNSFVNDAHLTLNDVPAGNKSFLGSHKT